MKKKLGKVNNKGMTIIELILCFAIVSVIVIALLNTVMNYKTKEQLEDTKKTIISYKNVITKTACKIYKKEKNNRSNFVRKSSFSRNLLIFDKSGIY